jgi:hypothetical protein
MTGLVAALPRCVLYRLSPGTIKEEDISYNEVSKWMGKYGVLERVTKSYPQDNILSKGRRGQTTIKRKPGVSPVSVISRLSSVVSSKHPEIQTILSS